MRTIFKNNKKHLYPRYTVSVNSSVLGADCDGYQHRYLDVRDATHDRDFFTPNIGTIINAIHMMYITV